MLMPLLAQESSLAGEGAGGTASWEGGGARLCHVPAGAGARGRPGTAKGGRELNSKIWREQQKSYLALEKRGCVLSCPVPNSYTHTSLYPAVLCQMEEPAQPGPLTWPQQPAQGHHGCLLPWHREKKIFGGGGEGSWVHVHMRAHVPHPSR